MRTIFKAYYKNSDVLAYHKYESNGILCEYTYDTYGNRITYKGSNGYSFDCSRDKNGNVIAYKDSDGYYKVKGKRVSEKEYEAFIDQLNSTNLDGKEVEIEERKYKLTLIK